LKSGQFKTHNWQSFEPFHYFRITTENLKDLTYWPEQREQVQKLGDRLSRISLDRLEKPVRDFLAGLGKLARPWLTALEETLLADVESAMGGRKA
jgi:hypothetical protein